MNDADILQFINKYKGTRFYQPIIFKPKILEIRGFWHNETLAVAEQICSSLKGKTVLDIGCNTGFFLHKAIEKGAKLAFGIDSDPHIVSLSREIFSLLSLNVSIEEADFNNFIPPQIFDVIFLLNVLHVAENPLDCFNRFLSHSNLLIAEHEKSHSDFFSIPPIKVENSSRANGRLVSYFVA